MEWVGYHNFDLHIEILEKHSSSAVSEAISPKCLNRTCLSDLHGIWGWRERPSVWGSNPSGAEAGIGCVHCIILHPSAGPCGGYSESGYVQGREREKGVGWEQGA